MNELNLIKKPNLLTEGTQNNLILPQNSSLLNYSELKEYYSPNTFRSFSIKYVMEGKEHYKIRGQNYKVESGQYLLANKFTEGSVIVDSQKTVLGICIDVSPGIISDVVSNLLEPNESFTNPELEQFFNTEKFLENKYNAKNTYLGKCLFEIENKIRQNPHLSFNLSNDFYYTLAEKIVADYIPVFKQLQSIKAVKETTRRELLRKILKAKEYMDANFMLSCHVPEVAKESALSEYHFFRLFRNVFKISPYQYLIQLKLNYAHVLINNYGYTVTETALKMGFSDISNFSRSYKKQFGYSPNKQF
jgi:AraC family transcriptional regulator